MAFAKTFSKANMSMNNLKKCNLYKCHVSPGSVLPTESQWERICMTQKQEKENKQQTSGLSSQLSREESCQNQ